MTTKPTLLEQSIESTKRLAWIDGMVRQYNTVQHATAQIMDMMEQQTRMDKDAYATLLATHALATRKLEILNERRQVVFEAHDELMSRVLDGEN